MAEEVEILKIKTIDAVESINDLKVNIQLLKEKLGEIKKDEEGYQETLKELKTNQNALKDAMYATAGGFQSAIDSATGASVTYNSLVHRMAELKAELRATDVSTTQGKESFRKLAEEINKVNDTLKEMDELQGNFQRNVGNYPGTIKTWSGALDALDKGFKATAGGFGAVKGGMDALAANPLFTILGYVIVPLVKELGEAFNEDAGAVAQLNNVSKAFEPMLSFFKGVLENVVSILADLIGKVATFIQSNGIFSKLTEGIVGVGNAILKFVIAPFKGVIAAIKVFQEEGVKGLRNAAKAYAAEMKNGFAFKSNFEAGAAVVDGISSGMKKNKDKAVTAAKEIAKESADEWEKEWAKVFSKGEAVAEARRKAREQEEKENREFFEKYIAESLDFYDELDEMGEDFIKKEIERQKAKTDTMVAGLNVTMDVLGSLADLMEANGEADEKSAKKAKALRISAGIIDTISGAIGAYMQAVKSIPAPYGAITGALQASAVTAAGMANVAKMRATSIGAEASVTPSFATPSISPAPYLSTDVPQVRSITGASEEASKKVVLVTSELEAFQQGTKVTLQEASF